MGLQPVGLAQGFYCGQISNWSGYSADVLRRYNCPHAYREQNHPPPGWVGAMSGLDNEWMSAHGTALARMLKEATDLGAHGIVGVTTEMSHPTNESSCEIHLYGTAVVVEGAQPPRTVWSTQLAGHKLAKLVEIGFVPKQVAYTRSTSVLVEGCNMEYFGSGQCGTGQVILPLQDAHELARQGAMDAATRMAGQASMYDVRLQIHESERYRNTYITCSLLGSVVRRVRTTESIAAPISTVSLA